MGIEELLKPRAKFILPYPLSHMYFEIGDVLSFDGGSYRGGKGCSMSKKTIEDYPHIFKPLEWWQDRRPEDMPEYIRFVYKDGKADVDEVYKITGWNHGDYITGYIEMEENDIRQKAVSMNAWCFPATEQEYNNQTHPGGGE